MTSLIVYTGDAFPSPYHNALIFVDGSKGCAYYFPRGEDGKVDFSQAPHTWLYSIGLITDIAQGPDRVIYLADHKKGRVLRISPSGIGRVPEASFSASVETGPSPLAVVFNAEASTAGPRDTIVEYAWDFEGDGVMDARIIDGEPIVKHVYPTQGIYAATLNIIDSEGLSATESIAIVVDPSFRVDIFPPSGEWCFSDHIKYAVHFDEGSSNARPNISWAIQALSCDGIDCQGSEKSETSGYFVAIPHLSPVNLQFTLTLSHDSWTVPIQRHFETSPMRYEFKIMSNRLPLQFYMVTCFVKESNASLRLCAVLAN